MRLILFALSASTLYVIWYFGFANGLLAQYHMVVASGKLPSTNDPLRTSYTGVEPVDRLLTLLTVFFYPALDGQSPGLLVHCLGFSGTFGAAWTLVVLESWRKGNAGTIAAYPMLFGLAAQVLTFACSAPLFLGLQLGSSITARQPRADNISVPRAVLATLPLIFLVGYQAPSIAMALPAPHVLSADWKQIAIAIWQPWPAYVSIMTTVAYHLVSPLLSDNPRASMSALRWVYATALATAGLAHLVSWVIPLASVVAPVLFKDRFLAGLHPSHVFQIPIPWSGVQIQTVAEGVHYFLRWDYLIGSAGVLLWAIKLYIVAHKQILSTFSVTGLVVKIVLLSIIVGPTGAAVELVWERDELVFKETGGSRQVSSKKKSS